MTLNQMVPHSILVCGGCRDRFGPLFAIMHDQHFVQFLMSCHIRSQWNLVPTVSFILDMPVCPAHLLSCNIARISERLSLDITNLHRCSTFLPVR